MPSDASPGSFNERLNRARQDDVEARERILGDERQRLRAAAQHRISPRMGQGDPSEIVQESLLVASQRLDSFQGQGRTSFQAWLSGIMNNILRRAFRTRAQESAYRQSAADTDESQWQDSGTSIGSRVSRDEQAELVRRAVSLLSPDDQTLIKARYWSSPERSFEELESEMGISAQSLRQRVLRLRAVLEEGLPLLVRMDCSDLPPHYQQIVSLKHFQKLSYEDIGVQTGTTAKAARKMHEQAEAWLQST